MCGFVGFFDNNENKEVILDKMMDRIIHRGPDMGGKFYDDNAALGFRRLSILDLSEAGCQPLYSEDKNLVLVFNGEIYNYLDIKEDLIAKGYKYKNFLMAYKTWCKKDFNKSKPTYNYNREDTLI